MIFDSKHVTCVYHEDQSDFLLVTFNGIGKRAGGRYFWGDEFVRKHHISALGFVSKRRNWFPRESMDELIEAVRPILQKYRHICTYGSSMGAYGAVKYSGRLGAHTVVAYGPQYSIDPAQKQAPFTVYYDAALHQDVTIRAHDLGGNIFIIYDPFYRTDDYAARYLSNLTTVYRLPMPLAGHAVLEPFIKSRLALEMLHRCMAGQVEEARRLACRVRHLNGLRPFFLACSVVPKHPKWAFAICEKHPEMLDENRLKIFCKAMLNASHQQPLNKTTRTCPACRDLIKSCPINGLTPAMKKQLQDCPVCRDLRAGGITKKAIAWARRLVELEPANARHHRNLAAFLHTAGHFIEAQDALRKAVKLEPLDFSHMILFSQICKDAEQFDDAVAWARRAVDTNAANPNEHTHADTYKNLISLYRDIGQVGLAKEALQEALRVHPGNTTFLEKKEFKALTNDDPEPVEE